MEASQMELKSPLPFSKEVSEETFSIFEEKKTIGKDLLYIRIWNKFYDSLTYLIFSIWRIREDSQYFSEEISWNAQLVIP